MMDMISTLFTISTFTDFAIEISQKALEVARANNADEAELLLDNRSRVIQIIEKYQNRIVDSVEREPSAEMIELVNTWQVDLSRFVSRIDILDNDITYELERLKQEIIKEIGTMSANKKSISGYNLQTTK